MARTIFNGVDGGFVLKPPVDAIAEFRILTHTSNAEFGHSTGSTTNIITRSGTNSLHGALWEFLRNDAFDAKVFLRKASNRSSAINSAALSWPIKRDKLSSSAITKASAIARVKLRV